MTVKINADTSDGLKFVSDTSGIVEIQSNGTTKFDTTAPSFSAYQSSQQTGISNGATTKINFQTEEWDTNSDYDTSNSRFTPSVAGYYQITIGCQGGTSRSGNGTSALFIYKNGSKFKDMVMNEGHTNQVTWGVHTAVVSCNGSSDYIEAYVNADGMPSTFNLSSSTTNHRTFFQAVYLRGL
jgi:hypothetical protein|tara:strand:- start:336 stop:881 length:546 start_codon:yes stop_codon:yes gene_type:complete